MPDSASAEEQTKIVRDEGALGQDQLDQVSGGIGSATSGAGAGKMTFDDESPKEEIT